MKSYKVLLSAIILILLFNVNSNAAPLKWYSFNEGYQKALKEKKFLLVDFYTDWCKWCKVMDEKTYSQQVIIEELNKNFVLVKLNPEKSGSLNYQGQTYSLSDFSRAANVSGFPATGFFTRDGNFISTITGYQDVEKFQVAIQYIINEHYMNFGYEDFQLFKSLESKYKDDPQNADLNFIMGYFYENVFRDLKTAKKHYLKSIEKSPKYSEVYSSLYLMAQKESNQTETDKWQKKARANGIKSQEQIMNKLKEVVQLYL